MFLELALLGTAFYLVATQPAQQTLNNHPWGCYCSAGSKVCCNPWGFVDCYPNGSWVWEQCADGYACLMDPLTGLAYCG
jgi:hypothetical protein